ncbi:MAG: nucleotidyl transferase AbiEii/AbiGii toxin family protein [Methylotenera sp.]|nr:nucleotidyl transferase AbiEii/AbiGii toxin family protein [Methylotenera sp.]
MAQNPTFSNQVQLLVNVLPSVATQPCFALKGGTALNLFMRDLPRLSVDIDLAYLPIADRESSLVGIDKALENITAEIIRTIPNVKVNASLVHGTDKRIKLLVSRNGVSIKVEVTPVLRGSVYESELRETAPRVQAEFGYAQMQLLSFEDLYAGKLCAALDRQHPRDLYDVKFLLENEGISEKLKDAFIVYLLGHPRPMSEVIKPRLKDIEAIYHNEFKGMTIDEVSLESLRTTRTEMISRLHHALTEKDKQFLLAVKRGDADWSSFTLPEVQHLPAIQWKLHNLAKMQISKRKLALTALENALY